MREKEWLVFKEEWAGRIKARDTVIKVGCILLVLGLVLSGIVATAEAPQGTMIFVIFCVFLLPLQLYILS